jgi:hypothetical protein
MHANLLRIPHMQWVELHKSLQPYLLLIATALISNFLVPAITRRWQDHQKELELKTGFVSEISESVMDILLATQFAEVAAASQKQEQYNEAYRTWEKRKAVIGAKLRAYFPRTDLGQAWDQFGEIVSEVYALSGTNDPVERAERLSKLKQYFGTDALDWQALANLELKKGAWFSLRQQVLRRKDALIQRILDSKIVFFP